MGLVYSKAESSAPPPVPNFADLTKVAAQVPSAIVCMVDVQDSQIDQDAHDLQTLKEKEQEEKIDYLNLPPALKYEDIQRETLMALKPETFEVHSI